ncbi:MAG: glutamate 5-kinase, partial [Chloroflexus aggregans]
AGHEPDVIVRVANGERIGTYFPATTSHPDARQRWILAETVRHSKIVIDEGAATALIEYGKSLLAAGVREVSGEFDRGQTVRIFDLAGREIARGLTQYRSSDLRLIAGLRSHQIGPVLGYDYGPEIVHRDDMVVLVTKE